MAPCQSCHAGCCRSFAVPITGADIVTIERRFGHSFWDFVCRWVDPEGKIARGRVPHFYFADCARHALCDLSSAIAEPVLAGDGEVPLSRRVSAR